ncbi:hypothetical protein ACSBOX_11515 [Arthrobacter sp. KN11-1C]|uniref:hypothetical protein n=1 Tax=Arthrobacter sp. KN11-1C TaxID=3445774 RepID=UPI003F9EC9E1
MASDMKHFGTTDLGIARISLLATGVDHLEVLLSHGTMSFSSLPRLLMGNQLPWPFLAMARICAESAARFCYVIDPGIAPEERLMRMAALMLWSNSEESKMAKSATNSEPVELEEMNAGVEMTLQGIGLLVSNAGFEIQGNRVIDPSGTFKPTSSTISAVELMRLQFPELGEESYRRLSGFVHGAAWALGRATRRFAVNLHSPTIDVMTVIWGFDTAGRSMGKLMTFSAAYAGIPIADVPRRLEALYWLCRKEHELIGKRKGRERFVGPGRGWNSRFSSIIVRAWGHAPLPTRDSDKS